MATMIDRPIAGFDEERARQALAYANPNALRLALYQATGDPELAAMEVVDETFWNGSFEVAALAPAHVETVREKAMAYLRSGAPSRCPKPDDAELRTMLDLFAGKPLNDDFFNIGKEEIGFDDFPRGVEWSKEPSAEVKAAFKVVVIGAGIAGMTSGVQLDRLGIPYEIIERNPDVGGTWFVNDYPDARVDIPSHHYQVSYTKNYRWKHWFAPQPELREYMNHIADEFHLRSKIRFNTEATAARWDEAKSVWHVTVRKADGGEDTITANAIISAAGLFNAVNTPDLPGIETFKGKMFHTTAWDHSYDYTGKKVAQIGVGCTGAQLAPAVAKKAGHLTIFQRSPQWITKIEGYRDEIPDDVQWLFDNVPHYLNWFSFSVGHTMFNGDGPMQEIDWEWRKQGGIINKKNDGLRNAATEAIKAEFPDNPELAKKLTPDFPPFAKRPVVDNGWFETLKRPNVTLVTEGIETITPKGVRTVDGKEYDADLLVLGIGFKTERYLWPTHYEGRDGTTLEEAWGKDGARAYLGIAMPKFPNLFIIYGPNMQARSGGLFAWLEIWSRYAIKAIVGMIEEEKHSIEIRQDVFENYNDRLDEADRSCIWGFEGLKSYYVNTQGRQGVNNPFRPLEFYSWTREPKLADYVLIYVIGGGLDGLVPPARFHMMGRDDVRILRPDHPWRHRDRRQRRTALRRRCGGAWRQDRRDRLGKGLRRPRDRCEGIAGHARLRRRPHPL